MKTFCIIAGCLSFSSISFGQVSINSQWTFVKGDQGVEVAGNYGQKGVPAATNKPGGRFFCTGWVDSSSNVWLFGGSEAVSAYNDLWKFSPITKNWTWISGDNTPGSSGVYGAINVAAASNKPGAREAAVSWIDDAGNGWLFGGQGLASTGYGYLNDLWKYDPTSNVWTWIKGENTVNSVGSFGVQNVASNTNTPSARQASFSWKDLSGNLWLFGGQGYDALGRGVYLNDLWKFNVTTKQWTWAKGDNTVASASHVGVAGVYGTFRTPSSANKPGSRSEGASWVDASGYLWLFGGGAVTSSPTSAGIVNDLWRFNTTTSEWTWMSGSATPDALANYGSVGVAAASNVPGARLRVSSCLDNSGSLLLFGGAGYTSATNIRGNLCDLWKYDVSTNLWTWIRGTNTVESPNIYGTQGVADINNRPGARSGALFFTDRRGYLWLFGGGTSGNQVSPGYPTDRKNDLWNVPNPYTFTGSGDWNTPSNWLGNLVAPNNVTAGIEVNIQPAAVNGQATQPGNLAIQAVGRVIVQTGKNLNLNGNFDNVGSMEGSGNFNFVSGTSSFNSTGIITTPMTLSSKRLVLNSDMITGSITLTNTSKMFLNNFNLDMGSGVLTGDANNFVVTNGTGKIKRVVSNSASTFHIGSDSTSYTPVTITNSGVSDSFSVRVVAGVLTRTSTADPITLGAVNRTWLINEAVAGGSNLNLTMQWNGSDEQPGFQRDRAFIAKGCPPPTGCVKGYEDLASVASIGSNPYTISRTSITTSNQSDSFIVRTNPVQYTFTNSTGNGNWNAAANWSPNFVPSIPIQAGTEVIINPPSGSCNFSGDLIIQPGGILRVFTGKTLIVSGKIIQQ